MFDIKMGVFQRNVYNLVCQLNFLLFEAQLLKTYLQFTHEELQRYNIIKLVILLWKWAIKINRIKSRVVDFTLWGKHSPSKRGNVLYFLLEI